MNGLSDRTFLPEGPFSYAILPLRIKLYARKYNPKWDFSGK